MTRLFYLGVAGMWVAAIFLRAAWFFKRRAHRVLDVPESIALSRPALRRLKHYFYGTTYLYAVFCALRGRPRSGNEKRAFTHCAALAFCFDDLADKNGSEVWGLDIHTYGRQVEGGQLALHFFNKITRELDGEHRDEFIRYAQYVFQIETRGRQRSKEKIEIGDLKQITAEKGGYSVLMFRRILNHSLAESEQEALFQFGHFIQLCDDIFDVWFDERDGIVTLPLYWVEQGEFEQLEDYFYRQADECRTRIFKTGYPLFYQHLAWATVYFIVAITEVCLAHYRKMRVEHGILPLHDRSVMVVDMEKWHFRRAVFYTLLKDNILRK